MSTFPKNRTQLSKSASRYRIAAVIVLAVTAWIIVLLLLGGRDAPTWAYFMALVLTFDFPIGAAIALLLIAALYELAAQVKDAAP